MLDAPLTGGRRRSRAYIDWPRRFDHMQQHTGQHLLSAVFEELYSHADPQLPSGRRNLHHRSRRVVRTHWSAGRALRSKTVAPKSWPRPARSSCPTKTPPSAAGLRKESHAHRHAAHRLHRGSGPQRLRRHARRLNRRNRAAVHSASWKRSAATCGSNSCAGCARCGRLAARLSRCCPKSAARYRLL